MLFINFIIGLVLNLFEIFYKISFRAVPYGTKCALVCEKNYIPVAPQFKRLHQCGIDGWEDPDEYDTCMVCEYSGELNQESYMKYRNCFQIYEYEMLLISFFKQVASEKMFLIIGTIIWALIRSKR